MNGKTIQMTADNISLQADRFSLDKYGDTILLVVRKSLELSAFDITENHSISCGFPTMVRAMKKKVGRARRVGRFFPPLF